MKGGRQFGFNILNSDVGNFNGYSQEINSGNSC